MEKKEKMFVCKRCTFRWRDSREVKVCPNRRCRAGDWNSEVIVVKGHISTR